MRSTNSDNENEVINDEEIYNEGQEFTYEEEPAILYGHLSLF